MANTWALMTSGGLATPGTNWLKAGYSYWNYLAQGYSDTSTERFMSVTFSDNANQSGIVLRGRTDSRAGTLTIKLQQQHTPITMTQATPCVVTDTGNGFSTGQLIVFATTGTLYTGITADTSYYLRTIDGDTFNIYDTYAHAIAGGTTVATITITYADSTKAVLSTVAKT